jgi:DNA-binding response OmpR family regulator
MNDKKIKLLLVDDNTQLRDLIRLTFKRFPEFEIFEATNGLDGLKQFEEQRPDIVLSDVMMQGDIDGLALCRQIKASSHPCRVILLSGKAQQSDIDMGIQAGADIYKVKPFSPMEIIDVVKNLIS